MPSYYNQYQPNYPQQPIVVNNPNSMQIQNGGFVSVRNEEEARNYPVAFGNSVTFRDETAPYIYTKTMGFSQLDRPIFDKYKLIKEDTSDKAPDSSNKPSIDIEPITNTIDELKGEIEAIWGEIRAIKDTNVTPTTKRTTKREKDGED